MAAQHNRSAVCPAVWDLAKVDEEDSSIVWCIINDRAECKNPIKLGLGGDSVIRHFSKCHSAALQFVENAIKQTCRTLPLNKDHRKFVLSVISNEKSLLSRSIEDVAGHPDPPGLAHYRKPTLIDALDLEDCPATLKGAISVYRRGNVILW